MTASSLILARMILKLNLFYVIVITCNFVYTEECKKRYQIQESQEKLSKVLTFVEKRYYQINFDGLLGIVLAQGKYKNMLQIFQFLNQFLFC